MYSLLFTQIRQWFPWLRIFVFFMGLHCLITDLLSHYQLYTVANDVIKLCSVPSVRELNQQSTTVHTNCNLCNRLLNKSGWYCTSCRKHTNCCSICQLPVRGLYVWCQGCSHGGHLQHIQEWMKKSPQCPTGCGHYCEYI